MMIRTLLLLLILLLGCGIAHAQSAAVSYPQQPRPVPTKPGNPCNARDFIAASDTGVSSLCNPLTTNWGDVAIVAGGAPATRALDNLASVNINTSLLAQSGVDTGSTSKPFRNFFLYGSGTYGTQYIEITGAPTGTRVLTLPDATDTLVGKQTTDTLTNKTISGSSNTLTNIPAANITGSNTLPDGVLSTNVPLINAANGFTGANTFTKSSSGTPLATTTSVTDGYAATFTSTGSSGHSQGVFIQAGTTSADNALRVYAKDGVTALLQVYGDGGTVAGAATGGDKGAGAINAQAVYVNNTAVLTGNQSITLSGDGSGSGTTAITVTLATVNTNTGSWGSATQSPQFTVNGKGLITAAANVTITPAVGSITGLGTGVPTALGVNVGSAGAPVLFNGAGGTPTSMVGTNITGLPISTGLTGAGTGVLTALANPINATDGFGTIGTSGAKIGLLNAANTVSGAQTFTADVTHSGSAIILSGNISASGLYSTSGIRFKGVAGTFTDTTSSGTVATAYNDVLGGNTWAASSATTITNGYTMFLNQPVTGSNVAFTNKWAFGTNGPVSLSVGATTSGLTDLLINPTTKASGNLIDAQVNSVSQFSVTSAGLGSFSGTSVSVTGANAYFVAANNGGFQVSGRSRLTTTTDGVWVLTNNAASGFTNLSFGGTSSSFPALKRSSTTLAVRLADDSADAPISASNGTLSGTLTYGGVTLTNAVTGTGKMVLDTSPQFTTGIGIGVAAGSGALKITNTASNAILVTSSTANSNTVDISNTASSGTNYGLAVAAGSTSADRSAIFTASAGAGGATYMNIRGDGHIFTPALSTSGANQTGYVCQGASGELIFDSTLCLASKRSVKNDIKPLGSALGTVLKLQPRTFFYKPEIFTDNERRDPNFTAQRVGLIADEVQRVDSRLVTLEPDGKTAMKVRYDELPTYLIQAVKELNAKVERLENAKTTVHHRVVRRKRIERSAVK